MRIRHREVDGRRGRVSRHLQLQQRVVRGLRLAPTPAATRSDQTLRRYRVDHVDLLSDHLRVVDGAGIVFIHFHNNMLIHRPPAR